MTLEALMREAARAYDAGDFQRAEPLFLQIVGQNPRDADAWHVLAVMALRSGRAEEAAERAIQAHRLDRRNHFYLNTLGVAHAEAQRMDQAVSWLRRALKERPTHAESHYNLAKVQEKLGHIDEAERAYLRARQLEPDKPQTANSLAALYARQGRYPEALPLYGEAKAGLPDDERVAINCSVAALATAGPGAAIRELASFIERRPVAAAVRAELAQRLLAEGRFAEGWQEYGWRRRAPPAPRPGRLENQRILLLPDQGLGDHLFFLRFAAGLRRRASRVAFACLPKLRPLLEGADVVDELCAEGCAAADFDLAIPVGDLPYVLEDASTPAPVSIVATHVAQWRERLAQLGAGPYLGVTWRGGSKRQADAEFGAQGEDPLYKEVPIETLASALRGWRGTVLVLQRLPASAELRLFSKALGRQAHDLSALNEDLQGMAAVLQLIDEYVGVSNANMHIRAGLGKVARVLIPFPPEFRWMHEGDRSPWFPGFRLYRQPPGRDWSAPLRQFCMDLSR